MIIRALNKDRDWTFGKGKNNFYRGVDALALNVKTRLKSWKGDCFFATQEGVDWNNYIGLGTKQLLDNDIKRVILQTEGVLTISSYSSILDRETRAVTIEAGLTTIFGEVVFSEEI